MFQHATRIVWATACLFAPTGPARAAFTWDPGAVGLAGSAFTADGLVLGDHARVTFSGDGATFVDTGYLPVLGFTLDGRVFTPAGFDAADGTGWGAYIAYSGTGTQRWLAPGVPGRAKFERLGYEIVGHDGRALFSFDADGAPVVGGARGRAVTLAAGALVEGGLGFDFAAPAGPTIIGTVSATISDVPPRLSGDVFTGVEVAFVHPPGDYAYSPAGTLRLSDGVGHSRATLLTAGDARAPAAFSTGFAAAVPEPGAALLVGTGLLGLGVLRRRMR